MGGNTPVALNDPNAIGAEFVLIRFLDPTLLPGESYKYRARLVMRNPNFGKHKEMATESDADKSELEDTSESGWFECPQTATLPPEFHLYAGSAKAYQSSHAEELEKQLEALKEKDKERKGPIRQAYEKFSEMPEVAAGKKAVVQVQWWLPQVVLGNSTREPIGAWVTADLPVGPGELIGRKALIPLPLWSAKTENYVLSSRKLQKSSIKDLRPEEMPPGQIVNFTTPNLLIDFDGRKTPIPAKNDEEVANELLVLHPDGTIEVLGELDAAADKARIDRQGMWSKWVTEVKKRKEQGVPAQPGTTGAGGPGGRGGGGDDR